MRNFPHPLILASSSPHRKELLIEAGYQFDVLPPRDSTECGICTRETPPEMVARLAFQKAHDELELARANYYELKNRKNNNEVI